MPQTKSFTKPTEVNTKPEIKENQDVKKEVNGTKLLFGDKKITHKVSDESSRKVLSESEIKNLNEKAIPENKEQLEALKGQEILPLPDKAKTLAERRRIIMSQNEALEQYQKKADDIKNSASLMHERLQATRNQEDRQLNQQRRPEDLVAQLAGGVMNKDSDPMASIDAGKRIGVIMDLQASLNKLSREAQRQSERFSQEIMTRKLELTATDAKL